MNAVGLTYFILIACAYGVCFRLNRAKSLESLRVSARSLGKMVPLLVAIFSLIGLFQVFVPPEIIEGQLGAASGWAALVVGREAGFGALLIAAACGTILIGPSYIIFPLLMSIRRQGARWAVITVVLAAYAVKIHMIPIEVRFLGWSFSLSRSLLTLLAAIPIGMAVEAVMEWPPKKGEVASRP